MFDGYDATLQHLGLLRQKRSQLQTAHLEAEAQHLQRISCAHAAGQLDMDDLAAAYVEYRAVADQGFATRWNEAIPVSSVQLQGYIRARAYRAPTGAHGTWEGAYPFGSETTPGPGTCVVYVLFDAANVPCYVGSTGHFRRRLHQHAGDGKQFAFWRAHPCASRAAAYALEDEMLRKHKPYLNKRAAA